MKRADPKRPPWMVSHSLEAKWRLYICIPVNSSRDKRAERTSDIPVLTAGKRERETVTAGGTMRSSAEGPKRVLGGGVFQASSAKQVGNIEGTTWKILK